LCLTRFCSARTWRCCRRSPTRPSSSCTSTRRSTPARCRRAGRCRPFATPTASAPAFRVAATPRGYSDSFEDYLAFLAPRLEHAHRLLAREGTLYFHIDYREAHHCKLLLDEIFGRRCFLNEIIWAYDYGARTRRRWPAKHDTILVYVKDPSAYHFDADAVDREPYMAPGLVTPEKAALGKLPTDVWWHTIVPTNGREKTGYPTQKPEGIVRRMVCASTRPGDWCLDFFAGSGTLGAVAAQLGRRYVLIDSSPEAVAIMRARLDEVTDAAQPRASAAARRTS
jgi:site-specific DNA-methyltransferase (adenine-specific)